MIGAGAAGEHGGDVTGGGVGVTVGAVSGCDIGVSEVLAGATKVVGDAVIAGVGSVVDRDMTTTGAVENSSEEADRGEVTVGMIEHTCEADRGVDGAGRMVDEDRQVPAKGFGDTKARRRCCCRELRCRGNAAEDEGTITYWIQIRRLTSLLMDDEERRWMMEDQLN